MQPACHGGYTLGRWGTGCSAGFAVLECTGFSTSVPVAAQLAAALGRLAVAL